MIVSFAKERPEPVEPHLLRTAANQACCLSDVSMAICGRDNGTCLDERGNAGCIRFRAKEAKRDNACTKRQSMDDARHHAGQSALIGGVQPSYRVIALGGR